MKEVRGRIKCRCDDASEENNQLQRILNGYGNKGLSPLKPESQVEDTHRSLQVGLLRKECFMICLEVLHRKDTKSYQNLFQRAAGGGSYSDFF